MLCKIYLQAIPDAPISQHLAYVVFLELVMGLILFYITFFGIPAARKKKRNLLILSAVLLSLLVFFTIPAMSYGIWQILSSVIPHIIVIFLAFIFRSFSDYLRIKKDKQELLLQNAKSGRAEVNKEAVLIQSKQTTVAPLQKPVNHIFVKSGYRLVKIFIDDILYIEGMRDYQNIITRTEKIVASHSMNELEKLLPGGFVRCHKSFIVSLAGITSIEHDRIKIGNKFIPIGDSYKAEFYKNI